MVYQNLDRTPDAALLLHDSASAVTADGLATVGGSAAAGIVDLGATDFCGDAVFDVSACDVATGDENYELQLIGSNSSSFASGNVLLGVLMLGDATTLAGGTGGIDTDKTTGRHVLTFRNRIGATVYRYVRLNNEIIAAGSSITFQAFVAPCTGK